MYILIMVVLAMFDAITTIVGLRNPIMQEANPLMRWVYETDTMALFIGNTLKLAMTAGVAFALVYIKQRYAGCKPIQIAVCDETLEG